MTEDDGKWRVSLPFITDELWEHFNETSLMTWDTERNRPHWAQDAVDFAACLEVHSGKQNQSNSKEK